MYEATTTICGNCGQGDACDCSDAQSGYAAELRSEGCSCNANAEGYDCMCFEDYGDGDDD